MIGGLIKHDNQKTVDKIPVLGSLPLIGYLFSNRNKNYEERELVIFLTPRIIPIGKTAREVKYGESKEVFVNIEGLGEKALVTRLKNMAGRLEANEGLISKDKTQRQRLEEAAEIYRQIASQFPHSKEAPLALKKSSEIYYYEFKEYETAKRIAEQILERYPESAYVERAMKMINHCNKKMSWENTRVKRVRKWQAKEHKGTVILPKYKIKETVTEITVPVVKKEYKPLFDFRKKVGEEKEEEVKKEYKPLFDFRKKK